MTAKNQRKRDIRTHDQRASQITEKRPLDKKNEQAAKRQVVKNRAGRDAHQRRTIIIWDNFHARRQRAVGIDLLTRLRACGEADLFVCSG